MAVAETSLKQISELFSYKINRLSLSLSRSAASLYRQKFNVSIGEWRALALLAQTPNMTHNRLAHRAGLDKAQMSRVITKLADRGFVQREDGRVRTTSLRLTDEGVPAYQCLIASANERDAFFLSSVDSERFQIFEEVLAELTHLALQMERSGAYGQACVPPAESRAPGIALSGNMISSNAKRLITG